MADTKGTLPIGKSRLAAILQVAGDVVHIDDAVQALDLSRTQAAKFLSRWTAQGWLRRVGPGAYVPVQLELLDAETVVLDPWVLIPALFSPAYVGGRTAAEYWGLTEQIFRDIVVFTARPVRIRTVQRQNAIFSLKHIRKDLIFGTKTVWRGQSKLAVSDIHRTIVDMINNPATGGGIQHVADCFDQYMKREDAEPDTLIGYADRVGNGAIFKRLGFLADRHPRGTPLVNACRSRLTKGNAKLDSTLDCQRLVTRWRLFVPKTWTDGAVR